MASIRLYQNIVLNTNPVLRSDDWWLDCGKTYISGYRSVNKTDDQNDLFLYDRIERLIESSKLDLARTIIVQEDIFKDKSSGMKILQSLINKIISLNCVTNLDIRDSVLFEANRENIRRLTKLDAIRIEDMDSLNSLQNLKNLRSLEILITQPSFDAVNLSPIIKEEMLPNLVELVIEDIEYSALRVLYYFKHENIILRSLKRLKLSHVHGMHDYSKTLRELTAIFIKTVVPLKQLSSLELEISCEMGDCSCLDDFLGDISPELVSLNSLSLIEKTFATQGNHYTEENWDLSINKFILHLPNVSDNLKKLSIRHNCPINGLQEDSVEGNYIRRRTLYQEVLPHLESLRTLIAPTILQSLSSYEILVCDLLWNGCECEKCKKVLDIFDQFIQNHQFYSYKDGEFKDIIPTVFFAYAGDALSRRFLTETDWDLKTLEYAPAQYMWNLHGYESVHHFEDYDCYFDETAYVHLTQVISHFFNGYMDELVRLLPNLTSCVLSGIYYQVSHNHHYSSIYDP